MQAHGGGQTLVAPEWVRQPKAELGSQADEPSPRPGNTGLLRLYPQQRTRVAMVTGQMALCATYCREQVQHSFNLPGLLSSAPISSCFFACRRGPASQRLTPSAVMHPPMPPRGRMRRNSAVPGAILACDPLLDLCEASWIVRAVDDLLPQGALFRAGVRCTESARGV